MYIDIYVHSLHTQGKHKFWGYYVYLKRPRDQKMQMKATVNETWASLHLRSNTNWSPPCPRRIEAVLKQKEPLPSIEYIYSKWTYFPEGQHFTKLFFYWSYEVF